MMRWTKNEMTSEKRPGILRSPYTIRILDTKSNWETDLERIEILGTPFSGVTEVQKRF